jgi:outer membrane protein
MSPAMKTNPIADTRSVAMNPFKIITTALGACLAMMAGAPTFAQDATPNDVRIGLYFVFYHTSADDVQGLGVPPGVTADAKNLVTAYAAYVRTLSSHFVLELAAGYPPTADTIGKGPEKLGSVPWNGVKVGSVKWFSPSALLEYEFGQPSDALRPFVGAGVNFTHFYHRYINAEGDAALGGPTRVTLKNSIGPAGTLGLRYQVMDHWHAVLSFSAAQVETRLTAYTDGLVRRSNRVNFDPQTIVLSGGYSF